jgi:phosphonate transport system substrate-binding protein
MPTPSRPPALALAALAMALALALAGLGWLGGCDREPAAKVDLTRREEITVRRRVGEITYAYLPQYTHAVSFERHHRLVERLEQATGRPFRQVFPASFDEHMAMFGQGLIDISYSNPFVYIKIAQSNGARAFARIVEPGGRAFSGQIITRRDSPVRTIEDCRGKRWIATDPSSAGGFLFPLGLFHDHGLRERDFAEIAFAGGNQEKVVYSVYAGEYDIGSIRNGTLDVTAARIGPDAIRVVAESPPYPNWVYAARGGLDQEVVARVREVLTSLDPAAPADRAVLEAARIERIVPATDQDFDPVRRLMAAIGRTGDR